MDSDYLKFTDNYDAPIDSNYSKYDKTYPYKESSYWCVVLKKQADSKIISELTTCQDIIYYANLGYVVIVAWENTNGLSPHYATVAPDTSSFNPSNGPLIANVGRENKILNVTASKAFGTRTPLRYFYNSEQKFREDYSQIQNFEK